MMRWWQLWARILKSVPDSRLLLKTKQLNDPVVCEQTRQRFAACGIAPDRLILGGMLASRDDHLAAYNKVDIALDTFPYPGVTTSVEALWMGVPVLSLHGDRFLSLTAKSIAHHAGLPDWVAVDKDNYVAKAVAFASDLERLAALRAGLRQQVLDIPAVRCTTLCTEFRGCAVGDVAGVECNPCRIGKPERCENAGSGYDQHPPGKWHTRDCAKVAATYDDLCFT